MTYDPPATPACEGKDPEMFDHPEFPLPALKICRTCDVRAWCLRQVNPAAHFYDGIVGGHAWKDGKPLGEFSNLEDPILKMYERRKVHAARKVVRQERITEFLIGKRAWNALNYEELVAATAHMAVQNYRIDLAIRMTNLDPDVVFNIYQNPTQYKNGNTK